MKTEEIKAHRETLAFRVKFTALIADHIKEQVKMDINDIFSEGPPTTTYDYHEAELIKEYGLDYDNEEDNENISDAFNSALDTINVAVAKAFDDIIADDPDLDEDDIPQSILDRTYTFEVKKAAFNQYRYYITVIEDDRVVEKIDGCMSATCSHAMASAMDHINELKFPNA